MVKDTKSLYAQVGMRTVLYNKIRLFFFFLLFAITVQYSAQQQNPQKNNSSESVISVIGDGVIYSKDPAFNSQIRNSENPQINYDIEVSEKSGLKITAKSAEKKPETEKLSTKKEENIVVTVKKEKEKKYSYSNFQKKEVAIKIKNRDVSKEFALDSSNNQAYFIAPNNDSSLSKAFIGYHLFQDKLSVKFPGNINYYYKNKNLKQQISIYKLSVRPPPVSIL